MVTIRILILLRFYLIYFDYETKTFLFVDSYTCSSLQKENAFWAQMRIVRGTTIGVQGNSFVGCLALACVRKRLIFDSLNALQPH